MWIRVVVSCWCLVLAVRMASPQVTNVQQDCGYKGDSYGDSTLHEMSLKMSRLLTEMQELKAAVRAIANTTMKSEQQPQLPDTKECPANFVYNSTTNLCYKIQLQFVTWANASIGCKSFHKDAHLVIVDSAAEQISLINFLNSHNASYYADAGCLYSGGLVIYGYGFFTAGQRIDPENNTPYVYRILNANGSATECLRQMTYTNWRAGEPNFGLGGGPKESCIHMLPTLNYVWNDCPCFMESCSVCEVDV